MDWQRIDLGEWLALLQQQNKLPELNANTLEQLNIETLTGAGSRLDVDQQRQDSLERLKARYENITPEQINEFHFHKGGQLRYQKP